LFNNNSDPMFLFMSFRDNNNNDNNNNDRYYNNNNNNNNGSNNNAELTRSHLFLPTEKKTAKKIKYCTKKTCQSVSHFFSYEYGLHKMRSLICFEFFRTFSFEKTFLY
jgi:hypothetical protein